jgi:hypothetical protein
MAIPIWIDPTTIVPQDRLSWHQLREPVRRPTLCSELSGVLFNHSHGRLRNREVIILPKISTLLIGCATLMLGACATLDSAKAPDANVKGLKSFYVTRVPEDERGIEKIIAARLSAMGYAATSGDALQSPDRVDAVVTYQDRWMWDITMYLIKLDVQIHDGTSGAVIARAQVMRPSLQRKSPEGMVQEVLAEIFK